MSEFLRVGTVAVALPILLLLTGCMNGAHDPNSPEFAARCAGAFSQYYVDGGKGPEYKANSKKSSYWRDRYYRLTGMNDEAAKKIIKITNGMVLELRKESIESRNKIYRQIMDGCTPYEV